MKTLTSGVCVVRICDKSDCVSPKRESNYNVGLEGTERGTSGQKRLQSRAETLSDEDLCHLIAITTVLCLEPPPFPFSTSVIHLFAITGRTATKQSLTEGETVNPKLGQMAECEGQMTNVQYTIITKAYILVLCDKGICNPGLSKRGMYHHISFY